MHNQYSSVLTASLDLDLPREIPPPSPVILFSRADPPARILASRRSLRSLAWSAALEGGVGGSDDVTVGVSAMAETDRLSANTLRSTARDGTVAVGVCLLSV